MQNPFRRRSQMDGQSRALSQAITDAATRLKELAFRHTDHPRETIALGPPRVTAVRFNHEGEAWPEPARRQAQ